jgi:spore coat protein U-like protein
MTTMAFGNYDASTGSPVDTTGTISFNCTGMAKNSSYNFCISLESGTYFSGSTRQLGSGTSRLNYGLYSDSARSSNWGSYRTGFGGSGVTVNKPTGSSTALNFTVTVYGRIFASQTSAPAGTYTSSFTNSPYVTWDEAPPAGSPCLSSTKTLQTSFSASATVVPTCQVSAANLNFGSVGLLTSAVDATTSVSVTCPSGTAYTVGLSAGNGSGATVAARKMTKSPTTNTVTYSLYRNAARSQVWGTTIGTDTQSGTGTGSAQSLTVYGRVPSQTTPPPGIYSDTIVVTVTY